MHMTTEPPYPTSLAPGARMTVVKHTPSNYQYYSYDHEYEHY